MILVRKREGGYVGVAVATPYPLRRVPADAQGDWVISKPISQKEFLDGMILRGHHGQDIWDVISEAEETGWGYMGV